MAKTWPTGLPDPNEVLSITFGSNVEKRTVQSGRIELRKFGTGNPDSMAVLLHLKKPSEIYTFWKFFEVTLNKGINFFSADWITTLLGYSGFYGKVVGYPIRRLKTKNLSIYQLTVIVQEADDATTDRDIQIEGDGTIGVVDIPWGPALGQQVAFWRSDGLDHLETISESNPWVASDTPSLGIQGDYYRDSGYYPDALITGEDPTNVRVNGYSKASSTVGGRGWLIFTGAEEGFSSFGIHIRMQRGNLANDENDIGSQLFMVNTTTLVDHILFNSNYDLINLTYEGSDGVEYNYIDDLNIYSVSAYNDSDNDFFVASILYHHGLGLLSAYINGEAILYRQEVAAIMSATDIQLMFEARGNSTYSGNTYSGKVNSIVMEYEYNEDSVPAALALLESVA